MNDVVVNELNQPAAEISWPTWVVNEMANHIYKGEFPGAQPGAFAKLEGDRRKKYTTHAMQALDWIVKQGWVRVPS
jgi:hypothetical protein